MSYILTTCGKCGHSDPIDEDNVWCKKNHETKDVEDACVKAIPLYAIKKGPKE